MCGEPLEVNRGCFNAFYGSENEVLMHFVVQKTSTMKI